MGELKFPDGWREDARGGPQPVPEAIGDSRVATMADGGKEWSTTGSAVARDQQHWAIYMGTLLIFGDTAGRDEVGRGGERVGDVTKTLLLTRAPLYTLGVSTWKGDDSLNACGWIEDKV
jgi:hypothetical protein